MALNTFITTQIELKKLKFHMPNKEGKSKCHKIHVCKNHDTCPVPQVHGTVMESVTRNTYLVTYLVRMARTQETLKLAQIYVYVLENFLNSVLTNAETWYSITNDEIKDLDDLDKTLLRKILKVPFSTPSEAYFLELGIIPIEVLIKARIIVYLQYVLKRGGNEMLYTFFMTQWHNEVEGDWTKEI